MAFNPSAVFNLLEGDVNYRKIEAQISAVPTPGIDVYNVYYRVDGPVAPLKLPDFLVPDGILNNGNPTAIMPLVNLPVDSTGATLEGNYTLTYFIENTSTPGIYTEVVSSIDLDVLKEGPEECRIQGNIGFEVDCVCYRITVTDNTYYGDPNEVTLESRSLEIIPPTIPGQATPTPITTTDSTITVGFDYSNVTYIVNLLSVYSHTNADETITVRENLVAQFSQKVVCDFNLCKLVQCIADTLAKLEAKAARIGGWPNLPIEERDMLFQLQENLTLLWMYRECGNYKKVYDIYNRIVDLVGCDCGCTDNGPKGNTEHPIPVSPACGGAGGNITQINGTLPVIVNQAGQTAVISLDPAFVNAALIGGVDTLNLTAPIQGSLSGPNSNILNLNLDPANIVLSISVELASQPYLTATANTPTPGNTELALNLSAMAWGPWIDFDDSYVTAVSSIIEYSTVPQPVRIATNLFTEELKVDGQFNAKLYNSPICLNVDISITLPPGVRVGLPISAFNASGDCVGYVALVNAFGGGPTDYRLYFYPNLFFVAPEIISINGRFNLS